MYDKKNASLQLATDGLIAGRSEGYGRGKDIPEL